MPGWDFGEGQLQKRLTPDTRQVHRTWVALAVSVALVIPRANSSKFGFGHLDCRSAILGGVTGQRRAPNERISARRNAHAEASGSESDESARQTCGKVPK
jgi:hypothetical protein